MKNIDLTLVDVLQDIAAERTRQVEGERFSFEHDDGYLNGELPNAAAAYAMIAGQCPTARAFSMDSSAIPPIWPVSWADHWFKPTTPRQDLVKAAALIIAEIQRLDRVANKG